MSDILGFVVSIALIYFGIKVAFKFIKWIGILLVVVFVFKMVALILQKRGTLLFYNQNNEKLLYIDLLMCDDLWSSSNQKRF